MAISGYHACDICGKNPTLFIGDLLPVFNKGAWRYGYIRDVDGIPGRIGFNLASLCNECEQTHEIIVRPKAPTTTQRSA